MEKFPQENFEQAPGHKVEIETQYQEFVPEEFKDNPLGYFESKGINIKSGEIQHDKAGKVKEDPTAVKDLPVWSRADGETLEIVGKRVNVEKSQVGKSGDPFYEYKIMEIAQEFALPAPRPVAKAEQDDRHLIVMKKVEGIRWTERDMRLIHESNLTEKDKQDLLKQAEEKMRKLEKKFSSIGLSRTWKMKDMIADVAIEDKMVMSITPTDWERTKIDQTKLAEAREKISEAVLKLREQLKESIAIHSHDSDLTVDICLDRMLDNGDNGKDYIELASYMDAMTPHLDTIYKSHVYPTFFLDAFDDWVRGKDIFANEKSVSSYAWNHTLRSKEKIEDQSIRMKQRFDHALAADESEINAGVYREELEPQVSDAVFLLRKKGYDTFQSGFDDLADGSQFFDFNLEGDVHDAEILKALFEEGSIPESLKKESINVEVKTFKDRLTVKFIPDNALMPLDQWKKIFDLVATLVPDRGHVAPPPTRLGSYETFTERQNKIKQKQKTYLGSGMEYDGEKVIERQ